ncbi:MAG: GumC family protein [Paracoccaceae bacterium]
MMNDVKFYARLLLRRMPAMAALFLLCSSVGVVMALRLPTTYNTSAQLLVEGPQVRDVSSIQVNATEQLEIIEQRLMTRANLLDVARDNQLFPNQSSMNPDSVVAQMRARTRIRRQSGRNRATLMTVGFEGSNPNKVAAVVNQYVTIILATNSSIRSELTEGPLQFFQREVSNLSRELDERSARIVAFKNENAGALPESLNFRLERQSFLQERLARNERELENLRNQRTNIQRIYETTGQLANPTGQRNATPEENQLRGLENRLRDALGIYSDQHPRVRVLRQQIANLQAQIAETAGTVTEADEGEVQGPSALEINLSEINTRIASLERDVSEAQAELARVQANIERTPNVRITLAGLEREFSNTQSLYNNAVTRLNQARTAGVIEAESMGQRISLIEPPSVPRTPSGPNRTAVAGMGVAAGLGLAAGLFILLELLNQAIRRPVDMVNALDVTPLMTIPRFETATHRRMRRMAQIATLGVVMIAVPATLWAIDTYYMPLDLLYARILERLI